MTQQISKRWFGAAPIGLLVAGLLAFGAPGSQAAGEDVVRGDLVVSPRVSVVSGPGKPTASVRTLAVVGEVQEGGATLDQLTSELENFALLANRNRNVDRTMALGVFHIEIEGHDVDVAYAFNPRNLRPVAVCFNVASVTPPARGCEYGHDPTNSEDPGTFENAGRGLDELAESVMETVAEVIEAVGESVEEGARNLVQAGQVAYETVKGLTGN